MKDNLDNKSQNRKLEITLLTNKNFKSKYVSPNKTPVIIVRTLSKDLQNFIYQQIKNGQLTQFDSPNGLAVSKEELENLITIAGYKYSTETIPAPNEDIDVSENYFFCPIKVLRENGINTTNFISTKSEISKDKYIDLRFILKQYISKIAKIIDCEPKAVLKQLEPLLKIKFIERKKKEIEKNEKRK